MDRLGRPASILAQINHVGVTIVLQCSSLTLSIASTFALSFLGNHIDPKLGDASPLTPYTCWAVMTMKQSIDDRRLANTEYKMCIK
jgi:hypothetical protein